MRYAIFEINTDFPIVPQKIAFLRKTSDIYPSFPKKVYAVHCRDFVEGPFITTFY